MIDGPEPPPAPGVIRCAICCEDIAIADQRDMQIINGRPAHYQCAMRILQPGRPQQPGDPETWD